jgi:hypothetical protein
MLRISMKLRRPVFPALALALGLAMQAAPAKADCLRDCWNEKHCDAANQSDCSWHRARCITRCSNQRATNFGAIAYGERSHAFGYSFDQDSAAAAERVAAANCRKNGDDCKLAASFTNACAAVASGAKDKFAVAQAISRKQAEADALAACAKSADGKCEIEVWTCALPSSP